MRWTFFGLLWILCLVASAQPGRPRVRYFEPADYGGQNQNWDLAQGEDGMLYVANSGGVLAFDGARWRNLPLPGGPIVRALHAADGRLYAGGYGQFGYFTELDRKVPAYHSLSDSLTESELGEEIWHIDRLDDGTTLLQSFARFYLAGSDSLSVRYPPGVVMFAVADGQEFVVPITERGLFRWRPGQEYRFIPGSEALGEAEVKGLVRREDGWLVATTAGLWSVGSGTATPVSLRSTDGQALQVNRLLQLRDGTLAVGTINDGLYLFGPDGGAPVHLTREDGLGNNTVLSMLEDQAGDLWVGLDRGLALVVRHLPLSISGSETAELGAVYSAARVGGGFYLGTNQGLYYSERAGQRRFRLIGGTKGQVWQLLETDRGLLCAHNEGTFLVTEDRAELLSGQRGAWQFSPLPGSSDRWFQATYTGLSLVDVGGGRPEVTTLEGPIPPLRSLASIGERELLAGHGARGLFHVSVAEDYRSYVIRDTVGPRLLTKPLLTDFGDTVIVSGQGASYHYVTGKLIPLVHFRGVEVPPEAVCLRGRPERGEWFLVEADRVHLYRNRTRLLSVPLRLHADYPTVLPWADNDYLLCLDDGYAILTAEEPPQERYPLRLDAFRGLDSLGAALPRGGFRLPFSRNDLEFRAVFPVFDREVRFRHRLVGLQENWSAWDERPEWTYSQLAEGDYRMEVETDWFGATAELPFTVLPPWYRTTLAFAGYLLLFALVSWLLYRLHRKGLAVQARRLEVVRIRQLQRQEIEARNQQLEEDIDRKNRELANTTLALAKKNEMLLEIREQADRGRTDKLMHLIERNLDHEADWALFEDHFNAVHDAFLRRLREAHPKLTTGDLQLAAYLKMNLSSKEIAPLLHISVRGVENKRYRLRKKLDLTGEDNLNQYLLGF